jgi:hypothetical protein
VTVKGRGKIAGAIGLLAMCGATVGLHEHPEILDSWVVWCVLVWVASWFWLLGWNRGSLDEVKARIAREC